MWPHREMLIMKKQDIIAILIGLFVWIVSNTVFYPIIITLIMEKGYPVFINHIYFFCVYTGIGFLTGWLGESRGWLLGLVFGVIITILFISISLAAKFLEVELKYFGYLKTIFKFIFIQTQFTIYLVIGGFLSNLMRRREGQSYNLLSSKKTKQ